MKGRQNFTIVSVLLLAGIGIAYTFWKPVIWSLILIVPLILIGVHDVLQKKHTILRNFPLVGHFRYLLESFRPEIMQYFVETDTEGRPINRLLRSIIYQRSKKATDTQPFGTQLDLYSTGYEWMAYSIYSAKLNEDKDQSRVLVGGQNCKHPYSGSILNISAMSYGSLSKNAILALNKGAKMGGFAHNTGEGSISPHHLEYGGDLIWQVGTGYFGCRDKEGNFDAEQFKKKAALESVRMIELKISQGAKPGHGGILPAIKNTPEIAKIRNIEPYTTVASPSSHTAFSDSEGLMYFIQQLRELSDGKPVGFKLCLGKESEFVDICKAMISTDIKPDFITVDGGEGGTGAAPVEFSNRIGSPLREGLAFAVDTLNGYDLKKDIKVIASGKVITGFHIARLLALGADMVNSARAMMMSIGCIQALQCNTNKCPVGVSTQDKALMKGLVVEDKAPRVANYHSQTIKSFIELVEATGVDDITDLDRGHVYRRVSMSKKMTYEEIYPSVEEGIFL
jgi:glutamate synthase domain-containing protein 2